jgi:hypothetical protein
MAHSNRKKIKDARSGLTKNQARKIKNLAKSSSGSERLANVVKWMAENEEKKRQVIKGSIKADEKVAHYSRQKKVIERRRRALKRLEEQLALILKTIKEEVESKLIPSMEVPVPRIQREINTLKSRI